MITKPTNEYIVQIRLMLADGGPHEVITVTWDANEVVIGHINETTFRTLVVKHISYLLAERVSNGPTWVAQMTMLGRSTIIAEIDNY